MPNFSTDGATGLFLLSHAALTRHAALKRLVRPVLLYRNFFRALRQPLFLAKMQERTIAEGVGVRVRFETSEESESTKRVFFILLEEYVANKIMCVTEFLIIEREAIQKKVMFFVDLYSPTDSLAQVAYRFIFWRCRVYRK